MKCEERAFTSVFVRYVGWDTFGTCGFGLDKVGLIKGVDCCGGIGGGGGGIAENFTWLTQLLAAFARTLGDIGGDAFSGGSSSNCGFSGM